MLLKTCTILQLLFILLQLNVLTIYKLTRLINNKTVYFQTFQNNYTLNQCAAYYTMQNKNRTKSSFQKRENKNEITNFERMSFDGRSLSGNFTTKLQFCVWEYLEKEFQGRKGLPLLSSLLCNKD